MLVMVILSVGAIIYDSKGKLLLQKRDLKKTIYFPGLWGVFGGACEKNESPSETIVREIYEELQISIAPPKLFITMEINSVDLGSEQRKRYFYEINFCEEIKHNIALQEGAGYAFFNPKELPKATKMVPFDLAAVTMFVHSRLSRRQITPIFD
jgi:8-oxo-dGTP pyrophosphatase MutT (NUDIX family)